MLPSAKIIAGAAAPTVLAKRSRLDILLDGAPPAKRLAGASSEATLVAKEEDNLFNSDDADDNVPELEEDSDAESDDEADVAYQQVKAMGDADRDVYYFLFGYVNSFNDLFYYHRLVRD